jgi:hypothetical protein
MISSISTIRSLIAISKQKKKKLKVIEIGPGSGMLGLLANWFNINYTSFDITNAFAIQVCTLYKFLFDKDFLDLSSISYSSNFDGEKKTAKASDDNVKWLNENGKRLDHPKPHAVSLFDSKLGSALGTVMDNGEVLYIAPSRLVVRATIPPSVGHYFWMNK